MGENILNDTNMVNVKIGQNAEKVGPMAWDSEENCEITQIERYS